jgi:hypothetical protein
MLVLSAFNRTTLMLGFSAFFAMGGANLVAGVDAQSAQPAKPGNPRRAVKAPIIAPQSKDPAIGLHGVVISQPIASTAPVTPAAPSAAPTDFYTLF